MIAFFCFFFVFIYVCFFFFFFQAEDGIRDFHVTGVQTCALPIANALVLCPRWRAIAMLRCRWTEPLPRVAQIAQRREDPSTCNCSPRCRNQCAAMQDLSVAP